MEDEFPKKRNVRPTEKSNLPIITLAVLVLLVLAMLYIGYEYISDNSSDSEELTSVVVDPTVEEATTEEFVSPADEVPAETPTPTSEVPSPTPVAPKEDKKPEPEIKEKANVSASSVGGQSITHKVKGGETWSSIASRYNLKLETLQGLNPSVSDLKSDMTTLSVQVQAVHTVGPGDVLRVVASKYGITKEALMKANGKSKDFSERGEKLIIPFSSRK